MYIFISVAPVSSTFAKVKESVFTFKKQLGLKVLAFLLLELLLFEVT